MTFRVPDRKKQGLATRAVHLPRGPESAPLGPTGERPHVAPIFLTSNFEYGSMAGADAAAGGSAFLYSRHGNPSVGQFEAAVADLEGAEEAVAFSSGMAALYAVALALGKHEKKPQGGTKHLVASTGLYGGTTALLRDTEQLGFAADFVPAWETDAVARVLEEGGGRHAALVVETVSNPLMRVVDLPALAELAQASGAALVVDATFTTPCLVRPLEHGATVVMHSVSKYLAGHGDVVGGLVAGDAATMRRIRSLRTRTGAIMDPFSAWLSCRGLRTLPLRIEHQCATASHLAGVLVRHPAVKSVHYPGLSHHPDHERAERLLHRPGALISFDLGTKGAAQRFYDRIEIIARAASLGDVTSLLTHPASFSHKDLSAEQRQAEGITDGLLRLSVGLEDKVDLEADVENALAGA